MKPAAALYDGGDVGDNWTTRANHVYPTAVKLQPPAYQHSVFYLPDTLPAPKPTVSKLLLFFFLNQPIYPEIITPDQARFPKGEPLGITGTYLMANMLIVNTYIGNYWDLAEN